MLLNIFKVELKSIGAIEMTLNVYTRWLIMAFMAMPFFAQEELHYKFTQSDSSYTFYGSFRVDAELACLLEISFQHIHIKALAPGAKEVMLIDQGNNWNKISYTYKKFHIFKNKTIWFRELDEEHHKVTFTLLSSENNRMMMPKMISSSGFYQIRREGSYAIVAYYQECHLTEKLLTKCYIHHAKNEAVAFIHEFSEYAAAFCHSSTRTGKLLKVEEL